MQPKTVTARYSLSEGEKHAAECARPRAQQRQKAKRLGNSQAAPLMEIAAPEDAAPCRDLNAGKRAGIPKGFCNKAQGCEQRATLGNLGRPHPLNLEEVAPTPRMISPLRRDCGMALLLLMAQLLRS